VTLVFFDAKHNRALAKPWSGVRRQRHMRRQAPQGAWPRARSARFVL
jgi:hypothetical protein